MTIVTELDQGKRGYAMEESSWEPGHLVKVGHMHACIPTDWQQQMPSQCSETPNS
jgi:hypothetical protein